MRRHRLVRVALGAGVACAVVVAGSTGAAAAPATDDDVAGVGCS